VRHNFPSLGHQLKESPPCSLLWLPVTFQMADTWAACCITLYQHLQLEKLFLSVQFRGQFYFVSTKQNVLYSQKLVSVLITFQAWQVSPFSLWNAEKRTRLLLDAIPKLLQIFPCSRFKPSETELWVFRDAHFKVLNQRLCPSKAANFLRSAAVSMVKESYSIYRLIARFSLILNSKLTQKRSLRYVIPPLTAQTVFNGCFSHSLLAWTQQPRSEALAVFWERNV